MKSSARETLFERLKTGLGEGIAHAKREMTLKTFEDLEEPPESDGPTLAENGGGGRSLDSELLGNDAGGPGE